MGLFEYLKKDIWRIRVEDLPKKAAFKVRFYRIFMLIFQGFTKKQVQQGASALTYYTLLSIVPILAFFFGIARGLFFQKYFKEWLQSIFRGQELVVEKLITLSEVSLKQGGKGVLTAAGILIVVWAAIRMLINIEFVMNRIWEVRARRAWSRRFTDYLAVLGFCPVLLFISVLLTAYVSTVIADIGKMKGVLDDLGPVLFPLLNVLPVAVSWLFLTFLYCFMPNTYVRLRPAFYAAVIAGTLYQGVSWLYFYLQIGVSHYNTVYGTFAALPLFLIWVHLSWIIVLIGAKIAFAFQHVRAYEFASDEVQLNHHIRTLLYLRFTHHVVKRFMRRLPPTTAQEISRDLVIPLPVVQHLLYRLVDAGVLAELKQEGEKMICFLPAIPIDQLTIKQVLDMIEGQGESIPLIENTDTEEIAEHLSVFSDLMERSEHNVLLKEIG